MTTRGFVYIAVGKAARKEARLAVDQLHKIYREGDIVVLDEQAAGGCEWGSDMQMSRWLKVNLFELSPFELTCYLDADCRVKQRINAGFCILEDGWDLVIAPSEHQGRGDAFWHILEAERAATYKALSYMPVQLQGGMWFMRKNARTAALFSEWRKQWLEWRDQDQAALIRALDIAPVRVWLLGHPWSNGSIISHRFGMCRA